MPFFSIIIPTYNRSYLIKSTIETIQNQSFSDWECIIVDDGSIDETQKVINEINALDKRIKYIFQQNSERSAARNNGILNSNGKYICFLDSDDAFQKNHLELLKEKILESKNEKAMFFTNYILSQNGKQCEVILPSLGNDIINYLFYNPIIPARVCIHSEILKEFKFDEEIVIVEDLLLWVKIGTKYPIYQLEVNSVIYNLHADNSINLKNNSAQKRLEGLILFFRKYPEIRKSTPLYLRKFVLGDTHFNIMKYHLYQNNRMKAIFHLLASIYHQGYHDQLKHKFYILGHILLNRKLVEYEVKSNN